MFGLPRGSVASIWWWWRHGYLSWPVATGGDDMATWLPGPWLQVCPDFHNWKHAVNEIKTSDVIQNEKVGNNTFKIYNVDHAVCGLATCDVAKKYRNINGIEIENQLTVAWRGVDVKRLQPAKSFSKGQAAVSFTSGTTYQAPNSRLMLRLEQVVILKNKQHAEARVVRQKQKTDESVMS
ncbi:hypothetical protein Tco_0506455 [Tanacetum coccineum]